MLPRTFADRSSNACLYRGLAPFSVIRRLSSPMSDQAISTPIQKIDRSIWGFAVLYAWIRHVTKKSLGISLERGSQHLNLDIGYVSSRSLLSNVIGLHPAVMPRIRVLVARIRQRLRRVSELALLDG
jgi:hypothetical protein